MKTFTVTFHHSHNYGALLQAYALHHTIVGLGHENTVFEYPYGAAFYDKINLRRPKSALSSVYRNFKKLVHKKQLYARDAGFQRFKKNRMCLSREFTSMDDLRSENIDADVLFTGSDQVWRFSGNPEFIPARFLDFGSEKSRRCSYAASIESLSYTEDQKDAVRKYLERFDNISLREESAREYISQITGKEAQRVLDPVFLPGLEAWRSISAERKVKKPYILCYQVQGCPGFGETVNRLKKLTGFTTVAVIPECVNWIHTDVALYDVSPEEFLGLILNSEMVVTASFHGTAFGLISKKPTYAVTRKTGSNRVKEIMRLFGAENFCVSQGDTVPAPEEFDSELVQSRISEEREKSLDYLKKCLMEDD